MKTYRQPFYKTNAMLYVGTCSISFIIIPLIRKSYGCQDIRKVEIGNKGGFSQNYIQVTKADKSKSIFLVIGLISKEDCTRLANDITSCGIDVEVNGHLK